MNELEALLTIEDVMRIFGLSRPSIYRRLREAREGRGGLPLPIPTGTKRRLLWHVGTVREFIENPQSKPPQPPIESEAKRAARSRAALRELEKFGIKIKKKENEE